MLAGPAGAYTLGLDHWFVDAVPEELRGRAMTLLTAGLMTIQGVGMALAGLAAEFCAVTTVVAGVGVRRYRVLRAPGGGGGPDGRGPGKGQAAGGPKGETGLTTI